MSIVSQPPAHLSATVVTPSVDDIVNMFVERNADRPDLLTRNGRLEQLIKGFLEDATAIVNVQSAAADESDIDVGEGLNPPLPAGEGARRLADYATPIRIGDWAGEVVGATDLGKRYGISRSTLHDWQKRGVVVGLLAGSRKRVFPVAQFIDGRPLEGLGAVIVAAGSPRTAWLWLVQPHPSLRRRAPLEVLKRGETALVVDLAERDFGPS
jgi:hypothetical protein